MNPKNHIYITERNKNEYATTGAIISSSKTSKPYKYQLSG